MFTVWVIIKLWMDIMYRNGLFLNYANIARSIQTYLNKQTGEETTILLFKQMQCYWCWLIYVQNQNHSQFKTNSLFCSVRTCLEIHTKMYNLSKTQVWCFFEHCWTIHCSCTTCYHSCRSFSPFILSIIVHEDTFLEFYNSWFSTCDRKHLSIIIWYLLYSYTDISSKELQVPCTCSIKQTEMKIVLTEHKLIIQDKKWEHDQKEMYNLRKIIFNFIY